MEVSAMLCIHWWWAAIASLLFASSPFFSSTGASFPLPLAPGWSFSVDLSLPSPLPFNAHHPASSLSIFAPILSSSNFSTGKGFSLGFLSLFDSLTSPPRRIYLTVCLGTNKTDSTGSTFAVPVWNANKTRPMKQVGSDNQGLVSLVVSPDRELVLRDGNGEEVWKVADVRGMQILDNGNWIILGPDNGGGNDNSRINQSRNIVWQSFDHPSDTLVQGQTLSVGMKIMSDNSLFTAQMFPGGMVFYMNSSASPFPLTFWLVSLNKTVEDFFSYKNVFDLKNSRVNLTSTLDRSPCLGPLSSTFARLQGMGLTVQGSCASYLMENFVNFHLNTQYVSDFVRIEDDAYARGYTYLYESETNYLFSSQAGESLCLAPNACGDYGICSAMFLEAQRSCRCPSSQDNPQLSNAFAPIHPSDSSRGCKRVTPLQCGANQTLAEIKQTTLVSIRFLFELSYVLHTVPLPKCIEKCLSNCSCAGFFYHHDTSFCLPFGDGTGINNMTFLNLPYLEYSTFVKIQSPTYAGMDAVPSSIHRRSASSSHLILTILIVAAAAVVMICAVLLVVRRTSYLWKLKGLGSGSDSGDDDLEAVLPMLPSRFSYQELLKATGGFSDLLGEGGCGRVYRGVLHDGRKVAVKKLDVVVTRGKEFLAEVAIIGGTSHYNVVKLHGFCSEKSNRLLVYELMENGSLDRWIFPGKERDTFLNWDTRYEVAMGTARGLAYLHKGCAQPIIHFDIKPQNILLGHDFMPKLADFGLSKLVGREASHIRTALRGTPGYIAPEWFSHGMVSKKCDVYGYGMVLLELVGGRRNVDQSLVGSDDGEWYFPSWAAMKCREGRMFEVVDKRLQGGYDPGQVQRMVHVAFLCIQIDPSLRPTMDTVCQMLEGSRELPGEPAPFTVAIVQPHLWDEVSSDAGRTAIMAASNYTSCAFTASMSGIEAR